MSYSFYQPSQGTVSTGLCMKSSDQSIPTLIQDRDISADMRRLHEEIEHLRKNVEIHNNLLHELSHNIKNPLSSILLLAERIQRFRYDPSTAQYFATLYDNVDRICNIINRVSSELHEHQTVAHSVGIVVVSSILDELVKEYHLLAIDKSVRIQYYATPEKLCVLGNESSICEILDNLLSNALKYTPPGSTITIHSQATPTSICISITDEGKGIKDDEKHLLFQKFSKLTARPTSGEASSGLGLYIAQRLAHAMNGVIHCNSTWGNGATFTIELPRYIPH
jgi:signal transduction histidine kinase